MTTGHNLLFFNIYSIRTVLSLPSIAEGGRAVAKNRFKGIEWEGEWREVDISKEAPCMKHLFRSVLGQYMVESVLIWTKISAAIHSINNSFFYNMGQSSCDNRRLQTCQFVLLIVTFPRTETTHSVCHESFVTCKHLMSCKKGFMTLRVVIESLQKQENLQCWIVTINARNMKMTESNMKMTESNTRA